MWRNTRGVVVNVPDCDIVVSEFKLKSSLIKDRIGIKLSTKVDMPLNKENKRNQVNTSHVIMFTFELIP